MKLPWVGRARYEAAEDRYVDAMCQVANLRTQLRNVESSALRRYDALFDKYHALRVNGANASAQGLAPAERSSKPADQAIEVAVGRFNGNTALRRRLQKWVHEERTRQTLDEDEIAYAVLNWRDPGEDVA